MDTPARAGGGPSTASRPEAWFRAGFERSTAPQALCDRRGRLTQVNEAFARLVGRPAEQLVGIAVRELNHRTDPGEADEALHLVLSGAVEAAQAERVYARPDGRPVPALVNVTLLRDDRGDPAGAAAHAQDLTHLHSVEERRRQQEEFFLALSQRASDLAIVLDASGRVLYTSAAVSAVLGHPGEEVLYAEAADFVHPEDLGTVRRSFAQVVGDCEVRTTTVRIRDGDDRWHWMELTVSNLIDTAVGGVVCNLRDITDRVRAEEALRASERRYRAIADNADEGLWVTDAGGRTVYLNHRMVDILGLDPDRLLGRPLPEVLDPAYRRALPTPTSPADRQTERYEVTYRHPDGGTRTLVVSSAPLDDADGTGEGWLAMVSDVTESRRLEAELLRAALHDSLTGLPNRALLLDRLEHALARESRSTAVLFVDLDRFKIVNDARGHAVGDDLLVAVAARLRSVARPADTVARFGGDEFLVVCEDVDEAAATALAGRLLRALDPPFAAADGEMHLSASIGVALSPAPSALALLRHADTAMYAAKAAGRSRVRVFDEALAASAEQRYRLGVELRQALATDALHLHYQPIVDLGSGRVVGAEALARWQHPVHGPVPPDRFVPAAEEDGLSVALDRWAVRRAVTDTIRLRAEGAFADDAYVAVNVSARSLGDPGLEQWVDEQVAATGLAPGDVLLEVTESAIMIDTASAVAALHRLRERGYGIAVDDFGTGHSSLAYLRRLPLTMLKVDRGFVAELTTDASSRAIIGSIIDLARAVDLTVVAEGVETRDQAELLGELGAHRAQGWLWSRAVSPGEAVRTGTLARTYDVGGSESGGG